MSDSYECEPYEIAEVCASCGCRCMYCPKCERDYCPGEELHVAHVHTDHVSGEFV